MNAYVVTVVYVPNQTVPMPLSVIVTVWTSAVDIQ